MDKTHEEDTKQLGHKITVLRELVSEYGGRTLENIIQGLEAKKKYLDGLKTRQNGG